MGYDDEREDGLYQSSELAAGSKMQVVCLMCAGSCWLVCLLWLRSYSRNLTWPELLYVWWVGPGCLRLLKETTKIWLDQIDNRDLRWSAKSQLKGDVTFELAQEQISKLVFCLHSQSHHTCHHSTLLLRSLSAISWLFRPGTDQQHMNAVEKLFTAPGKVDNHNSNRISHENTRVAYSCWCSMRRISASGNWLWPNSKLWCSYGCTMKSAGFKSGWDAEFSALCNLSLPWQHALPTLARTLLSRSWMAHISHTLVLSKQTCWVMS